MCKKSYNKSGQWYISVIIQTSSKPWFGVTLFGFHKLATFESIMCYFYKRKERDQMNYGNWIYL